MTRRQQICANANRPSASQEQVAKTTKYNGRKCALCRTAKGVVCVTYREWLRECAELRRECEQRTEQEDIEQRIKEEAGGKTRHRVQLGPSLKTRRFAESKAQELMEYLAANAARWQVELQQLAGDVDSEFLSENFVEFMQRPLLMFLAEKYPLRPGGIFHALNLEFFSEWTPTDESAQEFFFSQIPFGAWPLDDADMRTAWMEFLETWAGEDASPDSLSEIVLANLHRWGDIFGSPLHEATILEHYWRHYEDDLLAIDPGIIKDCLLDLFDIYVQAERPLDAIRCFNLVDEMAVAGRVEIEVYEKAGLALLDFDNVLGHLINSTIQKLRSRAQDMLQSRLGRMWNRLQRTTQRCLKEAEAGVLEMDFRMAALQYWNAIDNECKTAYRQWCRVKGYGEPSIEDKKDLIQAIVGRKSNRQTKEFIDACPDAAFVLNGNTCTRMYKLRTLRNKVAHGYKVESEDVARLVQSLWQDDFLKKYFQALLLRV